MAQADLKKVKVNQNLCIGCGTCVALLPKVFALDSKGKAKIISAEQVVSEEELDNVVSSCAVEAISYQNKSSGFSSPAAILIGSVIIAMAVLISGGVITVPNRSTKTTPITSLTPTPTQAPTLDQIKSVFNKSLIKFGDGKQKLTVIEVSDPSCPYCQIAAGKNSALNKQVGTQFLLTADGGSYIPPVPELRKLVDEQKAAFAYLYFPGHGNGEMGTKALYCAYDLGRFWQAHDLLMNADGYDLLNNTIKNDKAKSGELASFLSSVVNPITMKQCLDGGKYDNRLAEDMSLVRSIGVEGTPGFYLNNTLFAGAYSYKDMEAAINSILK